MTPQPLRVVVVDDEALACQRVCELVEADHRLELAGRATHGREALDVLVSIRPDLLFLDIRMPELDGFEVLEALDPTVDPRVVFVTAWDDHAVDAFDVGAVDYLLKPVSPARFDTAVARAVQAAGAAARSGSARALASRRAGADGPLRRFVVRRGPRHELVPVADIHRIEADGNYLRLHVGGGTRLVRHTMKRAAERLDPEAFVRVHRSHIVAVAHIRSVETDPHGDFTIVLRDSTRLPVSRGHAGAVRRLLGRG